MTLLKRTKPRFCRALQRSPYVLASLGFAGLGNGDQRWLTSWRAWVDDRTERSSGSIRLDAVALAGVVLHGQGVPKDQRTSHREAPAALLARQRYSPEITPRLL